MAKLILRSNYLKDAPVSHIKNFIQYIGTREGVERVSDVSGTLQATIKQKALIAEILKEIPETKWMHEYHDYLSQDTRKNASEFITQALENNIETMIQKKNYIDYLANRPRVEKIGPHGLFSFSGQTVILSEVADEISSYSGVVWTNIISLRREDAERLGYDNVSQWQELIRGRIHLLSENFKIDIKSLKWYAAFHNESHHPHVHLVVYSANPSEGFLSKRGIQTMRSTFAHDIFRQDFMNSYGKKTKQRDEVKKQAKNIMQEMIVQMRSGCCHNEFIMEQMELLTRRLKNTGGKKVYGYLKADVKAIVNGIVDSLAEEEAVAKCYQKWQEHQNEIYKVYMESMPEPVLLSKQKEFKSIKNMVIAEAVKRNNHCFFMDDETIKDEARDNVVLETVGEGVGEIIEEEIMETLTLTDQSMKYYAAWNEEYKTAKNYLYGTEEMKPDLKTAYQLMHQEAEKGNALAIHDIAYMYSQGIYVEQNNEYADEWYQKAFLAFSYVQKRKGRPYLEYRIGKMHQYGLGTAEDASHAVKWFQKAVDKEHKYAQYSLGMLYYHGKGVVQDYEKAWHLYSLSHDAGNAYASYELAKMYEKGIGIRADIEQADACYQSALSGFLAMEKKSKDDKLLYRIGCMYLKGMGTKADEKEAELYLTKSSAYGNLYAKYQLANLYIKQEKRRLIESPSEEVDFKKIYQAIKWLALFAEKENPFAAYALGNLYSDGTLIATDMSKAIRYLEIAEANDNEFAQYKLGKIYLSDEYKDIEKAVHYLIKAAKQDNDFAAYQLGKLYFSGKDVPKNVETAMQYFVQAADLGNSYAQYVVGKLYLIGKDVPQDEDKASYYLSLSAEQGNMYAAYLLEHWNDGYHPDALLMATRLLHHVGNIFNKIYGDSTGTGIVDKKTRRKIREKKTAQGHATDDSVSQNQNLNC